VSNLIGKLVYSIRHRNKRDPYSIVEQLIKSSESSPANSQGDKGKVLIVPYRVSGSNTFEGNVSLVLKSRGYSVDALLCGGEQKYCDNVDQYRLKWPRCKACVFEQDKFSKTYGVKSFYINESVNDTDISEVESFVESLLVDNIELARFRGVPIRKPLLSAVQLYKKQSRIDFDKDKPVILGFVRTICSMIIALDKYFETNKVHFVLLSHGVYSSWGTVQEYCLIHKINFVTWGREYNGAGVIASHNDSYLNEPMYEKNSIWDKDKLTKKQELLAIDYLNSKTGMSNKTKDYVDYHKSTKRILPENYIRKLLGVKDETKVIGLFPNIPWDGQTFRPNKLFSDINSWIYETIEYFRNKKDVVLVIRSHPAELHADGGDGETISRLISEYFQDRIPSNIIILPPDSEISSLSIASISKGCILYGSTVGYETMYLRIPTILASDFFYSNKQISFDPDSKERYFQYIDEALMGCLSIDDLRFERLLQYTYHYQYRRILPETLMHLNGLRLSSFRYETLDDFVTDKAINKFIDICFSGTNFYFDDLY
jgi:hypothetical protein